MFHLIDPFELALLVTSHTCNDGESLWSKVDRLEKHSSQSKMVFKENFCLKYLTTKVVPRGWTTSYVFTIKPSFKSGFSYRSYNGHLANIEEILGFLNWGFGFAAELTNRLPKEKAHAATGGKAGDVS